MIPAIMKAIRIHGHGDSSVLLYENAPVPSILPDEVLRQKVKIDKNEKGLPTAILLFCDPAGSNRLRSHILKMLFRIPTNSMHKRSFSTDPV